MKYKICLIGCGNIGRALASYVDGEIGEMDLIGVMDKKREKAESLIRNLRRTKPKIAENLEDLLELEPNLTIEAASQEAVREYAERILDKSDLMIMSVGALMTYNLYDKLVRKAREKGRKIFIPSGALLGIDGIKAASIGRIDEIILTTTKNPRSFEQTNYLTQRGIDLGKLKRRTLLYEGIAEEAAKLFPSNLNIAATLSYASLFPEKVKVRVVADPEVKENVHELIVRGDFGEFQIRTKNFPSPANPKTSYLAVLSAIRTLRKIVEPVEIGT